MLGELQYYILKKFFCPTSKILAIESIIIEIAVILDFRSAGYALS